MGYLDNRARVFKDNVEPPSVESSTTGGEISSKAKFKRVLFAVLALGVVAAMQYADESFFQRKVKVVATDDFQRVEPTFFENLFCKGNRVPKFCR